MEKIWKKKTIDEIEVEDVIDSPLLEGKEEERF